MQKLTDIFYEVREINYFNRYLQYKLIIRRGVYMKINYNVSAMIANNKLNIAEGRVSKSLERLSSGYKINEAKDNPSGMAISRKLREQINGLDRASSNTSDAISAVQTADSALQEITSIVQRIRELNVQALNDVYTDNDRAAIQEEVDGLTDEIDRIVRDTEFNSITLLDGSIDRKGFTNTTEVSVDTYSTEVMPGDYKFKITQAPELAVYKAGTAGVSGTSTITAAQAGKITINGESVEIKEGETMTEVYEKLKYTASKGDVNVFVVDKNATKEANITNETLSSAGYIIDKGIGDLGGDNVLMFVSEEYGADAHVNISWDNADLAAALGLVDSTGDMSTKNVGVDAKVEIVKNTADSTSLFTSTATAAVNGDKVVFSDRNNFQIDVTIDPDVLSVQNSGAGVTEFEVVMEINDMGAMKIQVGGMEGQTVDVVIPPMTVKDLGLDNLNMMGSEGLNRSLVTIDSAMDRILEVEAKIGAYENRFETTVSAISSYDYNLEEAESRVMDTDMAEEMTNYQTANVIAEAATAMVAQANERPQRILQLLQ